MFSNNTVTTYNEDKHYLVSKKRLISLIKNNDLLAVKEHLDKKELDANKQFSDNGSVMSLLISYMKDDKECNMFKLFLQYGLDMNSPYKDTKENYKIPLFIAAEYNENLFKQMLLSGAQTKFNTIAIKGTYYKDIYDLLMTKKKTDLIDFIIENKIDKNEPIISLYSKNNRKTIPELIIKERSKKIPLMVENGYLDKLPSQYFYELIKDMCKNNNVKYIDLILNKYESLNGELSLEFINDNGNNIINDILFNNKLKNPYILTCKIKDIKGFNVDGLGFNPLVKSEDKEYCTPIQLLALKNDNEYFNKFIDTFSPDINKLDTMGNSIISYVVHDKIPAIMSKEVLINSKKDDVVKENMLIKLIDCGLDTNSKEFKDLIEDKGLCPLAYAYYERKVLNKEMGGDIGNNNKNKKRL